MTTARTKKITYSALMCTLLIISTLWLKFYIPGSSVMFTTQVLFILLCGQILPPSYCFAAVGTYLALGLMGIPVFSATQGLAVIPTPSFGYLLSFPVAAMAVSFVNTRIKKTRGHAYISSLAGLLIIYIIALSYIYILQNIYFANPTSFTYLLQAYCLAFLPFDIIKALLAAFIGNKLSKIL